MKIAEINEAAKKLKPYAVLRHVNERINEILPDSPHFAIESGENLIDYVETKEGGVKSNELIGLAHLKRELEDELLYLNILNLSIGQAVSWMKKGAKIAREGWNGKGMFIYYVPPASYPASGNTNKTMIGLFEDDLVPYQGYIAIKTTSNNVIPWNCSQEDLLAEDYEVYSSE